MAGVRVLSSIVLLVAILVAWPASVRGENGPVAQPAAGVTSLPAAPPPPTPPALPTLGPAANIDAYIGKPVMRVEVVLEGNVWEDVILPPASVPPGTRLTAAVARRALEELTDSGRFSRGRISVEPEGPGVRLVVHVSPRKLIERLDVDLRGAKIDREELLREADLASGGELVGSDLPEHERRIEALFARHGYPAARVSITTHPTDDRMRRIVNVRVDPGPPRIIQRRFFYVFGADPKEIEGATELYALKPKDRADETQLAAADEALANRLRAMGYHRAEVIHDLVLASNEVTLRVRVDTGAKYLARFEGNESYDADALSGALDLENDTDRSPAHLADKLHDFYQKRGFYDVEVTAEVRGQEQDKVRFLVFHIVEHSRVVVTSRSYPCLKVDEIKKLSIGPSSPSEIGSEIDSFLEEELPGADFLRAPNPRGLDNVVGSGRSGVPRGGRPTPIDLDPDNTLVLDTFERALQHVQELYRNDGYLHALVGPLQVVRARCDPKSPAGKCVPLPMPPLPVARCTYDASNLPLPVEPLDPSFTCRPDPARGIRCAPTVQLLIPIKLGPRSTIYDVGFTGVRAISERRLVRAAQLPMGEPANTTAIDEARRRMIDLYKEEGYAYADIKYTLEPSLDHTRVRVRFDVFEGEQVIVRDIVIRGHEQTRESVIRRRIALKVGEPYRASDVQRTQERIATLGVFASVNVALEDPYVPQRRKVVVITVTERPSQYLEVRPGFSTGEGFRGTFEYGHRNLFGYGVGFSVRVQLSYLPDLFILDPTVARHFDTLDTGERIARRVTMSLAFPEVGLGPLVRGTTDLIHVRDLERDFILEKYSVFGNVVWRPIRQIQISGGQSIERNDVFLFEFENINDYIRNTNANADLKRLLLVPYGKSVAFAQRFVLLWDRRDNSFNAHSGTYLLAGAELVNSYPIGNPGEGERQAEGHFVRLTQTLAGYVPIGKKVTFAAALRLGHNVQLTPSSRTYPDRLFFMGGFDSMRGWLQDTFVPQEYVDQIARDKDKPDCAPDDDACSKFTIANVGIRGANLMINPRFELRFPIRSPFDSVLFADFGNLWVDPTNVYDRPFKLRSSAGSGIRWQTPVGPLALDYGINLSRLFSSPSDPRRSYEDFGAFHFAIGLF